MNGVGWVIPANYEVMKMKAINHKPMIRPKGTLAFQDREEVRSSIDSLLISHLLDLKFSASQIIWFK
jgi:transposase